MTIDAPAAAHYPALKALWQEAFGDSEEFVELFFRTGFAPDRCRIATEGDRLLGGLYWFECECCGQKLAYLYAVAVKKEVRGKGVGRRLMEDTHRHLESLGYGGTVLCPAGEGLFGYYAALGYETCGHIDVLRCEAGAPVSLEAVTPERYGALRRRLLPENALVQEGALLTYLGSFMELYAGEGFVLAAYRSGGTVMGELLGDASAAPGIVAALGCREGCFRTPGTQTPFAMHRGKGKPAYLGLDLN